MNHCATEHFSSGVQLPHRRWLPLLAFFALGFDYRLSAGAGPSMAVLEVVAFIALGIWFLDLVWNQQLVTTKTLEIARELSWIVGYFVWAWITVWVGFTRSSENLWAFRNLFPSLVIAFVVLAHVRNREDILDCLRAYLLGVAVNLALATLQKILGYPYPNALHAGALIKMDLEGGFVTNTPAGFFVHPNGLAVYLIPAVIALLYGHRMGLFPGWRKWLVQLPMMLATVAVLYLTYAKGGLLWAALGMLVCLAPRPAKLRAEWLAPSALLFIPIVIVIGTDPFQLGIRTLNSMTTRFEIWGAALEVFAKDSYVPLFGNGFVPIYWETIRLSELPYLNAHNNILNQVISFGLPALVLYIAALVAVLRRVAQSIRDTGDTRLPVFLLAAIVALAGEHFFEPVLDSVALQAQYYSLLALALAFARISRTESPASA